MEKACMDHPYHNQKQGVCPCCLRERLSKLYAVAATAPMAAAAELSYSSSVMSCSSVSSFNHISPLRHRHQRTASDIMGSMSFKVSSALGSNYGLKKSRSIAFVTRSLVGDVTHGKNKKKGFWSKLLHLKGKKEVNLDGKIALKGFS
ncbi:uncharacterized protein LOC8280787 [Ricinus communis]|uniref:Uncharacterized protein n=1 Tax=Ricinus communis TaxID=3988 RepID=B9T8F5_RICCO|nr:uncharacterized protein LOC8280787 [Ricinus communis]EEF27860.1 conserved hypothetical protein [Ricinus communis]|eukprot:XP_002534524.1 uncharacterized protein LOC8280787 [Ricinus communis]